MANAAQDLSASAGPALRQPGPLELLDRALTLLRKGPAARVAGGFLASVPLAVVCLALYHLEVIEGVRSLRPLFAALLVLAFVVRALALSALAQLLVLDLRPSLPLPDRSAARARVCSIAALAALGLWAWLWPLAWLAQLSPFALISLVPLLALRGGVAPSWLARARCSAEGGMRAFHLAAEDAAGLRATLVFVELAILTGTLGLFANLYALTAFGLLMSSSLLGLDVAFVTAFLSADNEFVVYAVLALSLILFEPVRAAVAACVFADARGRKDGADLHAAVDALLADAEPPGSAGSGPRRERPLAARVGSAIVLLSLVCASARADAPAEGGPVVVAAESDEAVRAMAEQILARPEFAEFGRADSRSLESWLRELLERWLGTAAEQDDSDTPRVELPAVSPWLVMLGVAFAVLCVLAVVLWDRGSHADAQSARAPRSDAEGGAIAQVSESLSDARALAAAGDFGGALRALYASTLTALDRSGRIQLDPAKTNGQYLRALPVGPLRERFGAFTQLFDRSWYGRQLASRDDYERGLALAEQISEPSELPERR